MPRRRIKFVALWLFPREWETLRAAAFQAQVSMSKLLRDAALNAVIPPAGKHAAPGKHTPREPFGADEAYPDELRTMSGELHPELSEADTQEIKADSWFVDTQDADDYAAHERLMDGVEQ